MKRYKVSVEWKTEVEADDEDEARFLALDSFDLSWVKPEIEEIKQRGKNG